MNALGVSVVGLLALVAILLAFAALGVSYGRLRRRLRDMEVENARLSHDLSIAENADAVSLAAALEKALRSSRAYRDSLRLASSDTANVNVWVEEAEDVLTNYRYPSGEAVSPGGS